ncbi:hypothetical protein Droror1_Dr00021928 [Drosera rotundifolia]
MKVFYRENQTNTDHNIQSSAVKDRDEEDEREGDEESGFELPLDRDRRRLLLMEKGSSDGGEERRRDQGEYAVFEVQSGGKIVVFGCLLFLFLFVVVGEVARVGG